MMKFSLILMTTLIILGCTKDDFTWKVKERPCVLNFIYGNGGYFIKKVQCGSFVRTSEANGYHEYYIKKDIKLTKGSNYNLSISTYLADQNNGIYIYFDWNSDGDFNDISEFIASKTYTTDQDNSFEILVPKTAKTGKSSMRIIVRGYYDFIDVQPCNDIQYGESEDYSIVIK